MQTYKLFVVKYAVFDILLVHEARNYGSARKRRAFTGN